MEYVQDFVPATVNREGDYLVYDASLHLFQMAKL